MFLVSSSKGDRAIADIGKVISITGQVLDGSNNPVENSHVVLTRGKVQADLSNTVKSTITDKAGVYKFYDLVQGTYGLAIFLPGVNTPRIINDQFVGLNTPFVQTGYNPSASIISAATINPLIVGDLVTGIVIDNAGSGYSKNSPPVVTFTGGYVGQCLVDDNGSIAAATTIQEGSSTGLTISSTASINTNITENLKPQNIVTSYGTPGSGTSENVAAWYARYVKIRQAGEAAQKFYFYYGAPEDVGMAASYWNPSYHTKATQLRNLVHSEYFGTFKFGGGMLAYSMPEIRFYPNNIEALNILSSFDGWRVVRTSAYGVIDNYFFDIQLYNTIMITWPSAYSSFDFSIDYPDDRLIYWRGNEAVKATGPENNANWVAKMLYGRGELYGSRAAAYTIAATQKAFANNKDNISNPTEKDLQTSDSPSVGSNILSLLNSLVSDWTNFVTNTLSTAIPNFDSQVDIYEAVKLQGLPLVATGAITEEQYNLGKGFVGRDQFVAPVINAITSEVGIGHLPPAVTAATIAGILMWQAKDAIYGSAADAYIDTVQQSRGALTNTPPTWVTNRTFNVSGINKQYINGNWVNI